MALELSKYARAESVFPRQQSQTMRDAPWERREDPIRSYATEMVRVIFLLGTVIGCWLIFANLAQWCAETVCK